MDLQGKKVAILVNNYFEEAELVEPKKALEALGAVAHIVSSQEGQLTAMQHDANRGSAYKVDVRLQDADPEKYDALVIPGGVINADHLRMEEKARQWVKMYMQQGKPVAVICHGPWLLVSADCVRDRRLTSFYTLQDDIRNAGGIWLDEAVVVDKNLITSRKPDDLPAFNTAISAALAKK
jgi:protease I